MTRINSAESHVTDLCQHWTIFSFEVIRLLPSATGIKHALGQQYATSEWMILFMNSFLPPWARRKKNRPEILRLLCSPAPCDIYIEMLFK